MNIIKYKYPLKHLLKSKNISEEYLAKKLGKDFSTINRWTSSWEVVQTEPVDESLKISSKKQINILINLHEQAFNNILNQRRKHLNG
tara:strand:+ start:158 stop:418 length:261 start_codon:yes stop_codon:yes gene_type:complete